ncbi:hypothetical protein [Maribacter sp. 2-571]|uniref:hypothetical protein n=1 Tax=Maribacter sp. 2-571 TaxID=3417569 RepID=UPI003D3409F4
MKKLSTIFFLLIGIGLSAQEYWTANGESISYVSDNVGIGTSAQPDYRLAVGGIVRAREAHLNSDNWPDFVFRPEYQLPSLEDVALHIQRNGHLPDIPSAAEVAEQGVPLEEMNRLLLQKVEELTRYILIHDQKRRQIQDRIALVKAKMKGAAAQE